MKWLFALILIVLLIGGISFYFSKKDSSLSQNTLPTVTPSPLTVSPRNNSVFVPYWSFSNNITTEEPQEIYFGISVNMQGLDTSDIGYQKLSHYIEKSNSKDRYLAVRMIDSDINFAVLRDTALQDKIISQTLVVTKEHGFSGVVLDLESSSLSFDSVVNRISNFVTRFSDETHKQGFKFNMTVYGDTFYRSRPYDISLIGSKVDSLLIMSYDFHKARGNPGPTFPFIGREQYGYDFKQMIQDFKNAIPVEKLTVTFGLFGYDWEVDSQGKSTQSGEPITYSEFAHKFLPSCSFKNCKLETDPLTKEMKAFYTNDEGKAHIVWVETLDSVRVKKEYLKTQGIGAFSYWAYSYY